MPANIRKPGLRPEGVIRALDANFNRASEALRVIEDCVRFVLDEPQLTHQLKSLRHQLAQELTGLGISSLSLLVSRDTQADVGAPATSQFPTSGRSLPELVRANFKRLQEALRVMEEFAATYSPTARTAFEKLRYQSYILEKELAPIYQLDQKLQEARLCVILTGALSAMPLEEAAQAAIAGGADMIQLREKELPDREFETLAARLKNITHEHSALFIVNDRVDIARIVDADGVHLGQEDLSVASARLLLGPEKLVGVSTHSLGQAQQALPEGADYLGIGPAFPTATKPAEPVIGIEMIGKVVAQIEKPIFAIGGITAENLSELLDVGIKRVAVSSAIISQENIEVAARAIKEKLPA